MKTAEDFFDDFNEKLHHLDRIDRHHKLEVVQLIKDYASQLTHNTISLERMFEFVEWIELSGYRFKGMDQTQRNKLFDLFYKERFEAWLKEFTYLESIGIYGAKDSDRAYTETEIKELFSAHFYNKQTK